MNDKIYWVWLSRIRGLGSIKIQNLLEIYKNPKNIWNLNKNELMKTDGIGEKIADEILKLEYKQNLDDFIKYMERYDIKLITIQDESYPSKLKNIYDSPQILYLKGNSKILNDRAIAIVGSRECTQYGKTVAENISYELANKNINIISGMAKGIDSYAHRGCLKANGKTIAVLGSGLDRIYPKENLMLYDEIIQKGGAVISEYVIGAEAEKMNFPARNRIISGLSDGVIIVEAKNRSGALITVDFALEQGKNIFAIPGNILSKTSKGTNELIKQGAKCVTNVEDILEEYN